MDPRDHACANEAYGGSKVSSIVAWHVRVKKRGSTAHRILTFVAAFIAIDVIIAGAPPAPLIRRWPNASPHPTPPTVEVLRGHNHGSAACECRHACVNIGFVNNTFSGQQNNQAPSLSFTGNKHRSELQSARDDLLFLAIDTKIRFQAGSNLIRTSPASVQFQGFCDFLGARPPRIPLLGV